MEHLIFPIIILIIAIAKAASKARQDSGSPPTRRPASQTPRQTETEEERQRRFFEAVGLPPGTPLPPTVQPRGGTNLPPLQPVAPPLGGGLPNTGRLRRISTGYPHQAGPLGAPTSTRRIAGNTPPAAPTPSPAQAAPVWAAPVVVPVQPAAVMAMAAPSPATVAANPISQTVANAPLTASPRTAPQVSFPSSDILARLRDPGAIRQAIILREILGPPKALQTRLVGGEGALWMGE